MKGTTAWRGSSAARVKKSEKPQRPEGVTTMNMGIIRGGVLIGALMLMSAAALSAHHSFAAEFDAQPTRAAEGHGGEGRMDESAHMDSPRREKNDGSMERWMIEGGTPNTLLRRGLTKTHSLRALSSSWTATRPRTAAIGPTVAILTFPDGRKLFMGSSGTGAPRDGKDTTEK